MGQRVSEGRAVTVDVNAAIAAWLLAGFLTWGIAMLLEEPRE